MAPGLLVGNGLSDDQLPTTEDLLYEEELLRNPFSIKMWYVLRALQCVLHDLIVKYYHTWY